MIPGQSGSAPRLAAPAPAPQQQPVQRIAAAKPAARSAAAAGSCASSRAAVRREATACAAAALVAQNMPSKQVQPCRDCKYCHACCRSAARACLDRDGRQFRGQLPLAGEGPVIEASGRKANGGQNDGINIAVPQARRSRPPKTASSPIRAASSRATAISCWCATRTATSPRMPTRAN